MLRARDSLLDFATFTQSNYQPNWHHRVLCSYLEKWRRKEIQNLMVFMPPRHGKSELVSRKLPAWILGHDPDASIVACSYSADLAGSMNRDVQRIIDSPKYAQVFPETRLSGINVRTMSGHTYLRNSDEFEVVDRKGYYRCAGVAGGITGRGFDYGIIDDPYKDRQEANSPTIRRTVKDWFGSTFRSRRQNDKAGILLTMTRWHEDDLAGYLRELMMQSEDADKWVVLEFPAICEEEGVNLEDPRQVGEALWEERFSAKYLGATKATISAYDWSSIYQQKPNPAEGSIFQSELFRHFDVEVSNRKVVVGNKVSYTKDSMIRLGRKKDDGPEVREFWASQCRFFQCVDTAQSIKEDAAYTVVGTFAKTPDGDLLVWDIWRARLEVPYQFPALKKLRKGRMQPLGSMPFREWDAMEPIPWPADLLFCAVESKSSGEGIIQQGALAGIMFRELKAVEDKALRASTVSTMYYNGVVWHRRVAAWLPAFEHELLVFPNGAAKDQADVLAYAGKLCTEDELLTMVYGGDIAGVTEEANAQWKSEQAQTEIVTIRGYGEDIEIDFDDGDNPLLGN